MSISADTPIQTTEPKGSENPGEESEEDEEEGLTALGYAAIYSHFEVFKLKGIRFTDSDQMAEVLEYTITEDAGFPIAEALLKRGLNLNSDTSQSCKLIDRCLSRMTWCGFSLYGNRDRRELLDCSKARHQLRAISTLAKYGAKWAPERPRGINDCRQALLKMVPDYTLEFIWVMGKFQSCTKEVIQDLIRTPSMKRHLSTKTKRLTELLKAWEVSEGSL